MEPGEGGLALGVLAMIVGTFTVYAALFAVGNLIYGNMSTALIMIGVSIAGAFFLFKAWGRVS